MNSLLESTSLFATGPASAADESLRDSGSGLVKLLMVWLVLMLGCAQLALALVEPASPPSGEARSVATKTRTFSLPPVEAMHGRPEKLVAPQAEQVRER